MKKLFCCFVFLFLFVQDFFSFSRPDDFFSESGFIESYGNEPFNYPVFVVHSKKYAIETDEKSKRELLSFQGKKIALTGTLLDENTIRPESFKTVK